MAIRKRPTIDDVFRALGDPTRRRILEHISTGPSDVSSLSSPLHLTLAAVLQHVQALERSGLITTSKVGRERTCQLNPEGFAAAERWLADRRSLWEKRYDKLGALLEEDDD